ncbi:hypothetical protein BGZ57DRAFT_396563 [Hyaloscypha finlandica]|nr:hypothetical protein BGZ57DRAFT_396563 [Hyaloscypha finlandica]
MIAAGPAVLRCSMTKTTHLRPPLSTVIDKKAGDPGWSARCSLLTRLSSLRGKQIRCHENILLKVENLKRGEIEEVGAAARVIFSRQAGALTPSGTDMTEEKKKRQTRLASLASPIGKISAMTMHALRTTFTQRPWRRRIWVIQEVVSAREAMILCCERFFAWDLLGRLLDLKQETVLARYTEQKVQAQLASTMHCAILSRQCKTSIRGLKPPTVIQGMGSTKLGCVLSSPCSKRIDVLISEIGFTPTKTLPQEKEHKPNRIIGKHQ